MAVDKKISQLTSLAQVDVSASTDVLPIVDTSATETKKITVSALVGAGATAGISGAVLTNGTINSTTIGATTPSTGAFTTLSASSTVSGTGFSTYLASPPAIGSTAANTGAFTTLTTSSTVTLSGGTANGVLYLNGSKVATSGSALTFDGTTFGVTSTWGSNSQLFTNATASNLSGITARYNGANKGYLYFDNSTSLYNLYGEAGISLAFTANAAEGMRLTSTGLGIGTTSPSYKLHVVGGAAIANRTTSDTPGNISLGVLSTSSVATFGWRTDTSNNLHFDIYNGASWSAALTTSLAGNLGLGVTPSAWASGIKAYEIYSKGNAFVSSTSSQSLITANAYFDSAWKYGSTAAASYYSQNAGVHSWYNAPSGTAGNAITFTQAMTLDADGELGVGITSPTARVHAYSATTMKQLTVDGVGGIMTGINFANGGTTYGQIFFDNNSPYDMSVMQQYVTGSLRFGTNNTERARITSGGYFKASNAGTYIDSTGAYHEFRQTADVNGVQVSATNASFSSTAFQIRASRNTTNASFYALAYYNDGATAYKFIVADSGNVTNTNGSYGTISDAKMKTDIVDAGSQWADMKAVRFRKFKMKDDPAGITQLGVVAQELEQTSPGLVEEHKDTDKDGNDLGTTTKSVKTSVLLMKAAVALQEAMARIEQLEAKVAVLEGK